MRSRLVAGVVTTGALSGLLFRVATPRPAPAWKWSNRLLTLSGQVRRYLVGQPTIVTRSALPVLVVLHGRTMTPEQMSQITGFQKVVGPAILVYPAGIGQSWNAGACCLPARRFGVDDVAFITAVTDQVIATVPHADGRRVFLAGYSNGGRMAYRVACTGTQLFAGVAVIEAAPAGPCPTPRRALPFLAVASTADPLIRLDGGRPPLVINGYREPTVTDLVAEWRRVDNCAPAATTRQAGTLRVTAWNDCPAGARVGLDVYQGNRHAWPRGAAQQIWSFFRPSRR